MNKPLVNTQANEIDSPLNPEQVRKNVNLIQEIMKGVMQEDQHYGKIPGCGDKPALFKAGAEKLSLTFRLRPIIDNDRDVDVAHGADGHREIRVYCHILSASGQEIATGVGSCSTMESKYRYRGGEKKGTGRPVPKEYWNLKKSGDLKKAQEKIGGPGFGVGKIEGNWEICEMGEKMENPDIADTYNTVLKMAKKRAYVDGIISATATSDIFTQDIEEIPITNEAPTKTSPAPRKSSPTVPTPASKPAETTPASPPANVNKETGEVTQPADKGSGNASQGGKTISVKQANRMYAIAKGNGWSDEGLKDYLKQTYGVTSSKAVMLDDYEAICDYLSAPVGE